VVNVYSFVDEGDAGDTIQRPEDIVIWVALQTIECGVFIPHYTSSAAKQLILSRTLDDLFKSHDPSPIPTSPTTNLGHEEHRITSLENAYATQGGTWNRKGVTNSLHVGSTGAYGIARYEQISLVLRPKLRLTRR
jgi:hypothetical protein